MLLLDPCLMVLAPVVVSSAHAAVRGCWFMSLLLLLLLACCLLVAAVGSVTLFMLLLSPGGNAFLLVLVGFLMTTFPHQQQQHSSCCFCCGPYCLSHHLPHGSLPTLSSSIGLFLLHIILRLHSQLC